MRIKRKENFENRWFTMPKFIFKVLSLTIGPLGLAIYSLLAAHADSNYRSKMNYNKVRIKIGCTNSEAIRVLHHLEDLHLIKSEPTNGKTKSYKLLWIPPWGKLVENVEKISSPYRIEYSINNKFDIDTIINELIIKRKMNQQQETQFAYELAEALDDKDAIQMYIAYVNRFPESLLREILVKVLAVPDEKIRKTRGALFNYLIQQHAAKAKHYPRD